MGNQQGLFPIMAFQILKHAPKISSPLVGGDKGEGGKEVSYLQEKMGLKRVVFFMNLNFFAEGGKNGKNT